FERYVDDVLVHCHTQRQAEFIRDKVAKRLRECGLRMHPDKTKIVYCKDHKRREAYSVVSFDFLGFTFQPRPARSREGGVFLGFSPAISTKAKKQIHRECRSWQLSKWVSFPLSELARRIDPIVRGWYAYYSRFFPSLCGHALRIVNFHLR